MTTARHRHTLFATALVLGLSATLPLSPAVAQSAHDNPRPEQAPNGQPGGMDHSQMGHDHMEHGDMDHGPAMDHSQSRQETHEQHLQHGQTQPGGDTPPAKAAPKAKDAQHDH